MAEARTPPTDSVLPPSGDSPGLALCRRFCRRYGAPEPGTKHGPARASRMPLFLRLADGPLLCRLYCKTFALRRAAVIRRPRRRGRLATAAKAGKH